MMLLVQNTILAFEKPNNDGYSLERVLWISPDLTQVVLIDINDKKKKKFPYFKSYQDLNDEIDNGTVRKINKDPDLRLLAPAEDYLLKYIKSREAKWEIIESIVFKEPDIYVRKLRGPLVKEVSDITGKNPKIIYDLLKKYWFYGKNINGLLNDYFDCGVTEREYKKTNPGPVSEDGSAYILTEKDKINFKWAIEKFHVKEGLTIRETHKNLLQEKYPDGFVRQFGVQVPIVVPEQCPSERQFRYWYDQNYNSKKKYEAKFGKRKAEMNARALTGTPEEDLQGPGEIYEIDSTPADVILVSLDRETVMGRAHVYFVKDVKTRKIVGMHTCTNPSWEEEMVAIENAATNKVEYCARYGVDITEDEWPSEHLPKFIVGDRGEHKSKYANNLVNINVNVGNTPSYRGDLKPYIEQQFRRYNTRIRETMSVSAVRKEHRVRGDKNPEDYAVHTIEAFTKLTILFVLEFNKSPLPDKYIMTKEMFMDKVELTPLALWNWGMKKNFLQEMHRDLIRYNLLPKEKAPVTRSGISFKKMCYKSERGLSEGWFENENIYGEEKVTVNYDPRNCSSIFVKLRDGSYEQLFLTSKFKEYEDLHFNDVKVLMNYKEKQLRKMKKERVNTEAPLDAVAKELSKSETQKTKDAQKDKPKSAKHKNKRMTRNLDKRMISSENAWTSVSNNIDNNTKNEKNNTESKEVITKQSKMTEMQAFLMSKNKERRARNDKQ